MRLPSFALSLSLFAALLGTAAAMPIRPADNSIETIMALVREKHAPDDLTAYFDVNTRWKNGVLEMSGASDSLEAVAELRAAVINAHLPHTDTIQIVPQRNDLKDKIWAIVAAPSATPLPDARSSYASPLPAGTPMARLLDLGDDTSLVRLPDSHLARLANRDLKLATDTDIFIWNRRDKVKVIRDGAAFYPTNDPTGEPLMTLPEGAQLRLDVTHAERFEVALPDNTRGFVAKEAVTLLTPFQVKEETRRRESSAKFAGDLAVTAKALVQTHRPVAGETVVGMGFLSALFLRHDLILPTDAGLLTRAFPHVKHGRHGSLLKAGDLLLFKNDRGTETVAFVTAPGRFVTTGYADGRLGTKAARPLGRLVASLRPDYGFLNDPCLTSTRSNPFYQMPASKLVPCRDRAKLDRIR